MDPKEPCIAFPCVSFWGEALWLGDVYTSLKENMKVKHYDLWMKELK